VKRSACANCIKKNLEVRFQFGRKDKTEGTKKSDQEQSNPDNDWEDESENEASKDLPKPSDEITRSILLAKETGGEQPPSNCITDSGVPQIVSNSNR